MGYGRFKQKIPGSYFHAARFARQVAGIGSGRPFTSVIRSRVVIRPFKINIICFCLWQVLLSLRRPTRAASGRPESLRVRLVRERRVSCQDARSLRTTGGVCRADLVSIHFRPWIRQGRVMNYLSMQLSSSILFCWHNPSKLIFSTQEHKVPQYCRHSRPHRLIYRATTALHSTFTPECDPDCLFWSCNFKIGVGC
jgi:hypothetical protein